MNLPIFLLSGAIVIAGTVSSMAKSPFLLDAPGPGYHAQAERLSPAKAVERFPALKVLERRPWEQSGTITGDVLPEPLPIWQSSLFSKPIRLFETSPATSNRLPER